MTSSRLSSFLVRLENKSVVVGASSSAGNGHLCQNVRRSVQPASQRKLFGNDSSILLLNFSSNFSVVCARVCLCVLLLRFHFCFCFCFGLPTVFIRPDYAFFYSVYGTLLIARMPSGRKSLLSQVEGDPMNHIFDLQVILIEF